MIKNFTFGQYRHKNSLIHNLDARVKIIYVIILSFLSFTIKSEFSIIIFSLFILSILLLSKMGLIELVKNLRPFYFIFVFLFLMYLLFSRNQIVLGIIYLWRFLMLIVISMVLTYTTKMQYLIAAIEKLSKPSKIFGIKPRNIAVMISVAVRFVPVMFIRFNNTREAMIARLANFRKIDHTKLLVIGVLEKMFKSASNLSDAMFSRLYNENAETGDMMKLKKYDYLSFIVIATLILIIY